MTPHADLVARLRDAANARRVDVAAVLLTEAADALAALPPPADPPKVCPECGDPLSCIACEANEDARPEWRTSFGWMLEARFGGVPHWFEGIGGNSSGPMHLWTTDPARGIRLCRREDVMALIDSLNEGASVPMHGYPTQHGWCDLRPEVVTPIGAPAPADPPALVALVREWQDAERAWGDNPVEHHEGRSERIERVKSAEAALLAYPLPAAPPVTDEHEAAAREIMTLLTPLVTDAAIVGRSYGWPDVLAVVRVVAAKLRPPVTDTPQGCPTCGGPSPCGRCTTSNVVDLDALKARLENERLRAAAEIVKLIADDSWAITFQSLGQYRSALLKAWRDSAPAAPPQEDQ